jgi:hypothetical protein
VVISRAFPAKQKNFTVVDEVTIVDSASLLPLAGILRTAMIDIARAGLSGKGRKAKTDELYNYLAGDDFRASFEAITDADEKLQESLLKEQRAHQATWTQRDVWYKRIDGGLGRIHENISAVIERPTREAVPLTEPVSLVDLPTPPAIH